MLFITVLGAHTVSVKQASHWGESEFTRCKIYFAEFNIAIKLVFCCIVYCFTL